MRKCKYTILNTYALIICRFFRKIQKQILKLYSIKTTAYDCVDEINSLSDLFVMQNIDYNEYDKETLEAIQMSLEFEKETMIKHIIEKAEKKQVYVDKRKLKPGKNIIHIDNKRLYVYIK